MVHVLKLVFLSYCHNLIVIWFKFQFLQYDWLYFCRQFTVHVALVLHIAPRTNVDSLFAVTVQYFSAAILSALLFWKMNLRGLSVGWFWKTTFELIMKSFHQKWPISSSRNASGASATLRPWSEPPSASWSLPSLQRVVSKTGQAFFRAYAKT